MLDFGELDVTRPLVMVLNGWLRFGGSMANIAASHDPALPFRLQSSRRRWHPVRGRPWMSSPWAPLPQTKTILVDLEGRLPAGARRLRLSRALRSTGTGLPC